MVCWSRKIIAWVYYNSRLVGDLPNKAAIEDGAGHGKEHVVVTVF